MQYEDGKINLDDFVQSRVQDNNGLAETLLRAKGKDRTMLQFAKDCGYSPATFSRILNGNVKTPLSKELILAIADHAAEADSRDTILLQLLFFNGMVDKNSPAEFERMEDAKVEYDATQERISLKNQIKNILTMNLLNQGYTIRYVKGEDIHFFDSATLHFDLSAEIAESEPSICNFHVIPCTSYDKVVRISPDKTETLDYEFMARMLLDATALLFLKDHMEPDVYRKIRSAIVLNDAGLFAEYTKLLSKLEVNSALAVILVDVEDGKVVSEWYLKRKDGEKVAPLFDPAIS